jgi:hypothetical protein
MPIEIDLGDATPPAPSTPGAGTLGALFGASLDGVRSLIPEAKLPDTLPPGTRGVTSGQAAAWLGDLSRRVALRLTGWEQLRFTPTAEDVELARPTPRDQFIAAARDLVHTATASYVEAARFPERAENGYPAVLWRRFEEGLTGLAEWLDLQLNPPADGDGGGGAVEGGGASVPAWAFPPASFRPERLAF